MQVTFFSFLMTLTWCTVLILGIHLCRKTYFFVRQFGIVSIFCLYLFTIIRALMPVDFPFSIGINISGVYNIFCDNIYLKKFEFMDFRLSLFDGFLTVWLSVFFFLLIKFIVDYQKTIRTIKFGVAANEQYSDILNKVKKVTAKNINLKIMHSKDVEIPMAMGIINKKIILPDRDFNDSELFYILLHEYVHLINHDLLVKLSVNLFCYFFWWNPVVYLLKKDLNQILEIKCDLGATNKMSYCEKAEYLKCIVDVLKAKCSGINYILVSTLFIENCKFDIKERFKYVAKYNSTRGGSGFSNCIWASLFAIIIGFSYLLVIQPSYEAPVSDIIEDENVFEITPDIGYISAKGDLYFIVYSNSEMQEAEISEELATIMESQGFEIREESKNEKNDIDDMQYNYFANGS